MGCVTVWDQVEGRMAASSARTVAARVDLAETLADPMIGRLVQSTATGTPRLHQEKALRAQVNVFLLRLEKVTNKVWARKQRRRRKVQTDPVHTCLLTRGHKWRRRRKHDRPEKLKQRDRKHEKKPKKRSVGKKMKDGGGKGRFGRNAGRPDDR